ncbi:MAG: hypothetical protein PHU80_04025 [Kiritimatiellae bacterium]|nr:hypothetical protein [Kiritimatiellia bacterium]
MTQCQSSQGGKLLPEADAGQIAKVKQACDWDKVRLGASAQGNVIYWRIGVETLRQAVRDHIEKGRKVFRKPDPDNPGKLLSLNLQANVTLFEGKDIYVEMILTPSVFIILNAHEHTSSARERLPQ